ncbi:atypical membrane-integrating protein (Mistic protein) [Desertibacillus haloalkaliphilus]|uniref:atypical membrane-integrating protein (Mistic protein) n=1 Tax=Desertibacillus haloalkaliphilus TaxID=1328930 RepID=UPI001C27D5FF|nr:atypical membrane-integrating protein (Mistic protein) [Desertibacillus haloalkaliphilus]MBU8908940.1 atypical membrane-integrating protein (Mistic protein) [Desertibacillus haloalkaliphilus]
MKVSKSENTRLSQAIDNITDGLDVVIEMYNDSEEDMPLIDFDEEVITDLRKAINQFGADTVNRKINTIVRELLDWLPLEDVEEDTEEEKENDEDE